MDRWGVAALVDEPGALVAAFAGYYLDLGASEVHVMLDRPNEEARDLLSGVKGAILTEAGEDGWAFRAGHAPARHLGRQKYHASRVLAESGLDWVLHCDADEYLMPLRRYGILKPSVAMLLTLARRDTDWLHVGVAERVWLDGGPDGLLSGPFRLPWWKFQTRGPEIYDEASMLQLNLGVAGHHLGKGIARSGRGYFMGIHQPMRDFGGGGRDLKKAETRFLRLLHFDGLTLLHYALKMMRRALNDQSENPPPHADHRRLQFSALAGAGDDIAAIREQWNAAKRITARQGDVLRERGFLLEADPHILSRAIRHVPDLPELTPAAFDRALIARETALIERAHQAFGFDPEGLMAR